MTRPAKQTQKPIVKKSYPSKDELKKATKKGIERYKETLKALEKR